jgi:hypothetical protein
MIALALAIATAAALIVAGCSLTCRPRWYQPAAIDYTRLDADKRDATNLGDHIGDGLNARRPVDIVLDEAQINRWIAARSELPPGISLDLGPLRNPFVDLANGDRVRIGALVERGGLKVVASVTAQIAVDADVLRIRIDGVNAGAAPAPLTLIEPLLHDALARSGKADRLAGERVIVIPNDFTWPNGKRRFRITAVHIDDNAARIRLEPR